MNFYTNALLSLVPGIGAAIGLARFPKTDQAYLPFILLLSLAFCNELTSIILILKGYSNAFVFHFFVLLQGLLILWQFLRWRLFEGRFWLYRLLQGIILTVWLGEIFLLENSFFSSYFTILTSFIFTALSIAQVNQIIFTDNTPLPRHPIFLICIGFIFFFVCAIIVEMFMVFGMTKTKHFRLKIFELLTYVNLFVNLIYVYAVTCFPLRRQYILRF